MTPVTDPTEEYFKDGLWAWDGSVWRKLPLLFGYSDRITETRYAAIAADASHTFIFPTVPAGKLWVITNFMVYCTTANPTRIDWDFADGVAVYVISRQPYPTANISLDHPGPYYLRPDDYLRCTFLSCLTGDVIVANVFGYKMSIAE